MSGPPVWILKISKYHIRAKKKEERLAQSTFFHIVSNVSIGMEKE
jgi:hypothetical protein